MKLALRVPPNFSFKATVYSHGWCTLLPFSAGRDHLSLSRIFEASSGKHAVLRLTQSPEGILSVDVQAPASFDGRDRQEIVSVLKSCLRLDEDYSVFYAEAERHPAFRWSMRR